MFASQPNARRVLISAAVALACGLGTVSLLTGGFSDDGIVRLVQALAVFGTGVLIVGGVAVLALVRMAGWHEPESELEFEAIVERAERLARGEATGEDEDADLWGADEDLLHVHDEEDFRALVRAALDDLPLEFHRALEHVAVVVHDGGRERRAYGLYQGDTVAHDHFHDRIIIFRDTLTRDFGHDPDLLRAQVTRTVRHELAHHLGWDENGVRGLGL